jgi:ParB family transcriptional regulator, chromosome partitioning protein
MSSLKKFLESKNASILNPDNKDTREESPRRRGGTHTAPGALLAFNSEMVDADRREKALRDQLESFEGALPVRRLAPGQIRLSKWANRNAKSFDVPAFELLKREIAAAGENVQPVKVRPIAPEGEVKYELVFGQRRHRACLDLGIDVNAVVQEMTDQALFLAMDRENRAREDLSPYELGLHYQRALSSKLWPSQNVLASEVGITQAYVSKVLTLAALPPEVVGAFPSVLEIQANWGPKLIKRLAEYRTEVLRVAKKIAQDGELLAARAVFDRLMGIEPTASQAVEVDGKVVAHFEDQEGRVVIRFQRGALTSEQAASIPDWVATLLKGPSPA